MMSGGKYLFIAFELLGRGPTICGLKQTRSWREDAVHIAMSALNGSSARCMTAYLAFTQDGTVSPLSCPRALILAGDWCLELL